MSAYLPFIVIGLFTGSILGLAAMGVVLTYKTTGVFNFAYGAVAMFSAFTYWQVHDLWGWTAWAAIPVVLVEAAIVGVGFERIFRPLAGLSAEVSIVVSLALLAFLQQGAKLIFGGQEEALQPIFPRSTFYVGDKLHIGYDQLGTFLVSLALVGLLWGLLRHTRFGTATRAVVDNRDLSSMIGINGVNVRRVSWILSSVFGALVGILLSPNQGLDVNQLVLVVIVSFAPVVLARMTSLPIAYGSALVISIAQSIMSKYGSSGTIANFEASLPFLILLVALLYQGRQLRELGTAVRPMSLGTASSAAAAQSAAQQSSSLQGRFRIDRPLSLGLVGLVVALIVPTFLHGPRLTNVTGGVIYAVIAMTLVVLTGWAGQISLAQFSFVGIGAFTIGHLAGAHGQNFLWAALAGMAISIPVGLVVGALSLRLSGLFLAIATMAFALIMDNAVFVRSDVTGGQTGLLISRPRIFGISFVSTASMYELSVVVFAALALGAFFIRRGPIGRRLHILRDSPLASSTLGVNLTVTKLTVFVCCGAVAALGGALYAGFQQAIDPFDIAFGASLQLLLVVVLSGRSVITGAVIAGALYTVQHLPLPETVINYIPLAIAAGVIGLGRNAEGTVALSVAEAKRVMSVMRPRWRRHLLVDDLQLGPSANGSTAGTAVLAPGMSPSGVGVGGGR